MNKPTIRCDFCGTESTKVEKVIAGPNVHICNECVEICNFIIDDERSKEKTMAEEKFKKELNVQEINDTARTEAYINHLERKNKIAAEDQKFWQKDRQESSHRYNEHIKINNMTSIVQMICVIIMTVFAIIIFQQ